MTMATRMDSGLRRATARRSAGNAAPLADTGRSEASLVFLFLIAFMIPNQIAFSISGIVFSPIRFALLLLVIPVVMRLRSIRFYAFDWFFIAFVGWSFLAIITNRRFAGIEFGGQFALESLIPYFLAQVAFLRIEHIRFFVKYIVIIIAILFIAAIPESFYNTHYINNIANKIVGLPPLIPSPNNVRMGLQRAMTIFSHPIMFGVFCSSMFSFVLIINKKITTKIFSTIVIIGATFFSLSSAPFLVLFLQIILMVFERMSRMIRNRAKIVLGVTATLVILLETFTGRGFIGTLMLFTLNPATAYYRSLIWENGIDDVLRNPLLGFREEEWTRLPWMGDSVDNQWLLLMMRGGIPALIFLAIAILLLWRRLYRLGDQQIPPVLAGLRRGWSFMMVALLLCGATVAFFDKIQPFFALMIGIGVALVRMIDRFEKSGALRTSIAQGVAHKRTVL